MIKKSISLFIVSALVISVLTSCSSNSPTGISSVSTDTPSSSGFEESGDKSAESLFSQISTTTLYGEDITGDDFKGDKLTVLNVWATWCSPCVAELPHLQEISEYYEGQGVKIVGVMQDGVTEQFRPIESVLEEGRILLADAGAEYTVILPDEKITLEFINQMQFFPTTFFLDSEGNVVKTVVGSKDTEGWRKEIDAILEEIS